jgi:DNA modification methylase
MIWKDPLLQAVRTKALSLAHKQIVKDSAMCGAGLPDYIVTVRKPGINDEPIKHLNGFEYYIGDRSEPKRKKRKDPKVNKYSHEVWQRYASPVWWDINQTNTLNIQRARGSKDEKHICPLQLDTIARCLELWSNKHDTVLDPFAGIASTGYQSLLMNRNSICIELKESYYKQGLKNLKHAANTKLKSFFEDRQ